MTWEDIEKTNPVARQLRAMRLAADEVAAGVKRGVCLFGAAGLGKTHTITDALVAFKMRGLEPVRSNPQTYTHMLKDFEEADGLRPVLFEEADVIFDRERMLNILKIALDPSNSISARVYQGVNISAPIMITTNIDLRNKASWSKALKTHGPALFRAGRMQPVGVTESRVAPLFEYSTGLALHHSLIDHREAEVWGVRHLHTRPIADRVRALKWFSEQRDNLDGVSPASLKGVAAAFDYADTDHQELALDQLLVPVQVRKPLHPCRRDWQQAILDG